MADDIKKFLDQTKDAPDATEITIGDAKVPLGSLRALNSTERQQLADRLKAVEAKETELSRRQESVVDLAKKAQAAYDAAEEARRTAGTRPAAPGEDPLDDPWLKPVKSEFSKRDSEIAELKTKLETALKTVTQISAIGLDDRWDREYAGIDQGKREKKLGREELLKFATDNRLVDRHGIPSIGAAWNKMSEGDRQAEIAEKARNEGIEEGKRLAMAARVTPPGASGPGWGPPPGKDGKPAPGDLGDLAGEALKDPELRGLIEQAERFGVM